MAGVRIVMLTPSLGIGWSPTGEPIAARPDGVDLPAPAPDETLGSLMARRDALLDELAEIQRWWLAVRQAQQKSRILVAPAGAIPQNGRLR